MQDTRNRTPNRSSLHRLDLAFKVTLFPALVNVHYWARSWRNDMECLLTNVGHDRIRFRPTSSIACVLHRRRYTLRTMVRRSPGPPAQRWTTPSIAYFGRRLRITLIDMCYGAVTPPDSNVRRAAPRSSLRDYGW